MYITYLLLFIPAAIANGSPPFFSKLFPNFLNIPVDFGKSYRGGRVFGDHKTLRGFILGVGLAQLAFVLIYSNVSSVVPIYFGGIAAFSALLFDSIKSFFKRQFDIDAGNSWYLFDQLDWILGYLLVLNYFVDTSLYINLLYIIVGVGLHLLSKVLGYFIGVNDDYI